MTAHIHAELMAQYAEDAMETDTPWERWEIRSAADNYWEHCMGPISFWPERQYRRKLRTININGHFVHEPHDPESNVVHDNLCNVYSVDVVVTTYHASFASDRRFNPWSSGVHLTLEDAELHAKALLSFTRKDIDHDS